MEDVAPGLLKAIQQDFSQKIKASQEISRLYGLVNDNKATYAQAQSFAEETGNILSEVLKKHLTVEQLPDGKLYYNIANRVLTPTLKENHRLVSDISMQIQTKLNREAGIGIKAVRPEINEDRIHGIVDKVSELTEQEKINSFLGEPIVNFACSVVDDTVRANADFQYKAGLNPKIVRTDESGCCEWCSNLAGTYDYEDVRDKGNEVFRRHKYCRCLVEYDPGGGKRQNAHSKKWYEVSEEELEKRKNFKGVDTSNGVRKVVEKAKENDIIKTGARNPYSETADKHAEKYYGLVRSMKTDVSKIVKNTGYSTEEIQEIKEYLFIDKHDLGENGMRQFYPDYMIAESWKRLQNGDIKKHDLTLIKHEIMEKKLVREGLTQDKAHTLASEKYNYTKEATEFYDKIKKFKKER